MESICKSQHGNCSVCSCNATFSGLALELNIEQEDYIGVLAPEAGIRMDISAQGEMPFPLERGVSLAPGYATMIGLRKVTMPASGKPNRNRTFLTSLSRIQFAPRASINIMVVRTPTTKHKHVCMSRMDNWFIFGFIFLDRVKQDVYLC